MASEAALFAPQVRRWLAALRPAVSLSGGAPWCFLDFASHQPAGRDPSRSTAGCRPSTTGDGHVESIRVFTITSASPASDRRVDACNGNYLSGRMVTSTLHFGRVRIQADIIVPSVQSAVCLPRRPRRRTARHAGWHVGEQGGLLYLISWWMINNMRRTQERDPRWRQGR